MAKVAKHRKSPRHFPQPTYQPPAVYVNASVRFDVAQLGRFKPEQVAALFAGVAKVINAGKPTS